MRSEVCPCGRVFRSTAPQPSYQAPPPIPAQRRDPCCYLASGLGLLGLFLIGGIYFGTAAIVLGVIGNIRCENDPNLRGKWEARIGIVAGVITLIIFASRLHS
jgi:hypothetical protein